jgi:hypothetical protein
MPIHTTVRGAQLAGQLALVRDRIDGDDVTGSREDGPQDDAQADAARTEHGHRAPGLHARAVDGGADSRHDGAADERCHVERRIVSDEHAAFLRNDAALCERGEEGVVVEGRPVA